MIIGKQFTLHCAHWIPDHETCGRMHGHSYKVELQFQGPIAPNGMVLDFHKIKKLWEPIHKLFDHGTLNEHMRIPTAELLCQEIACRVSQAADTAKVVLSSVKVWETDTSYAEWRANW